MNSTLEGIFDRFPYLSADVIDPVAADHPQVVYAEFNAVDDNAAARYTEQLQEQARQWLGGGGPAVDAQFAAAIRGLRVMVQAVSATSLIMQDGNALLVERPGYEIDKKRRGEIGDLLDRANADWCQLPEGEKASVANLALLGIAPLQLELVNYLDVSSVPKVIGRMLSRLECVIKRAPLEQLPIILGPRVSASSEYADGNGLHVIDALADFYGIEQRALAATGLIRTTIPGGTRPRIYVPQSAMSIHEAAQLAAKEVLDRHDGVS